MLTRRVVPRQSKAASQAGIAPVAGEGDLSEMLEEIRILLPGAQVLTAFLITLPFSPVFAAIVQAEKWVYMATFLCSTTSLILFSAPAVQHRLMRPLLDRVRFKHFATRQILLGCVALSSALVLSTDLVMAEVIGERPALVITGCVALLIGCVWWLLPRRWHAQRGQ